MKNSARYVLRRSGSIASRIAASIPSPYNNNTTHNVHHHNNSPQHARYKPAPRSSAPAPHWGLCPIPSILTLPNVPPPFGNFSIFGGQRPKNYRKIFSEKFKKNGQGNLGAWPNFFSKNLSKMIFGTFEKNG